QITLYLTMADNIKELNEVIRKGRAVAATLEDIHDRTQLDAFVKKGHTAKLDVGQIVKEGQTIIEILDYESSRNHLNHVLKESIELLGKANQNGPKAKKRRIQSNGRVRCKLRKKSCPQQAKPSTSHDSRLKSRACPEPTERRQDQGPVHDSLLHELQELLSAVSCNLRSEGTPHSASMHWGTRTAASPERWGEARPSLINNRLATEQIEGQLCLECKAKVAVVKCKDCLPKQYTCINCDCAIHRTQVFHNRSTMMSGFHKAVPPTTVVKQDSDGQYFHHHEDQILPMALPNSICSCGEEKYSVGKARSITVINMKGRYELSLPHLHCEKCRETWVPGVLEMQKSGYWPATMNFCTIYDEEVFMSFKDLKMAASGLSRLAFIRMLDMKTVHYGRIKWSGSFQKGAAYTMGEEVEQANSFLSRIGISTKFMSKAGRTDLLTLQCMGWNKMKTQNMCQTICTRYQKTQQNLKKETESLQDMKKEQCVEDGVLHQWVTDVQEWAHTTTVGDSDAAIQPIRNTIEELSLCIKQRQHRLYRHTATNKGRNKIRRKINEERKKLASSIDALVDPSFKIVSIEEVLQNDLVFPWQLTEQDDVNLLTKKKVFDKVMLIQRLEEEQTVLVQEAKQHWLFLRSQEHKLNSLLDTIISGVNPWNLPDDGIQGLQCVLKRKLHELRAHQDSVKTSYQAIDTITEHFTVEECEYPSWAEPSGALYSSSTDLSSDEDDEDDTFLL
ncbi:hypothetical protein IRJ41_018890, partial [Triplophysa rosa]